jgi:hypothetical protein
MEALPALPSCPLAVLGIVVVAGAIVRHALVTVTSPYGEHPFVEESSGSVRGKEDPDVLDLPSEGPGRMARIHMGGAEAVEEVRGHEPTDVGRRCRVRARPDAPTLEGRRAPPSMSCSRRLGA